MMMWEKRYLESAIPVTGRSFSFGLALENDYGTYMIDIARVYDRFARGRVTARRWV